MSALSAARGQLWVFGGYVNVHPGFDPQMYTCDLETGEWSKEQSHGSPPLLALASCTLVESDDKLQLQLVVFGGSCCDPENPRADLTNDLWVCDLTSGRGGVTWSQLATEASIPQPVRHCW